MSRGKKPKRKPEKPFGMDDLTIDPAKTGELRTEKVGELRIDPRYKVDHRQSLGTVKDVQA
jgi:hypothetical protein